MVYILAKSVCKFAGQDVRRLHVKMHQRSQRLEWLASLFHCRVFEQESLQHDPGDTRSAEEADAFLCREGLTDASS